MRVVSNIVRLENAAPAGVQVVTVAAAVVPSRWRRNWLLFRHALSADYLVIHFELPDVMFFAVLLALVPFHRCRLVTLDFFIEGWPAWTRPLVRWCLSRISRLLVYFRDSSHWVALYGIPASRFQYVPFKINSWERVRATTPRDEGFIFVGGRSRRDFRTLFEAVRGLPYPVKLLTAREDEIRPHGSSLAGLDPPPNVEICFNDSDSAFFVDLMSRSRLVVLPIVKNTTTQAGIAVYLLGMALRKCVIVSEAPGVNDVLLDGQACILPPGDAAALRAAIETLWNDDALRERIAGDGYRYAITLEGEERLRRSVLEALPR